MVVGETEQIAPTQTPHPSGVPQEKIDNIMSGISNTGVVKMNNHRKKLRQRFDIIKKLGQGTYGKVQLGINKETGQEVAIKTIKKCKIEAEADLIRIRREVQIMSSVQHPNIIHIYEVFENREKMVLVMEFAAGGELYDYLSEQKVLPENEARRIFRQVSTAVYYCHKHKICHRDLKLENILLDEKGNAKIADFGLSNVFDEQRLLATFCGSPLYASPEIVKGTPYQGPEVDCWSLGVLLYTLVYGAMPFDGSNFKRLVKQISQGDYYEPKKPSPASPLIREMLTVCPQRRATIEQICNHWWVNEGYKESCLDLAEELANQTPVRLDVLLSLSPPSVTAEQLVVPSHDEVKTTDRVARSHSVGSIRDIGNTEAERRILDMVAAGGEAALMPSPTRTITPAESPVQTKRKLENTVSVENATGTAKKKEKPTEGITTDPSKLSIVEMDVDQNEEEISEAVIEEPPTIETPNELEKIENICDKLIENSEQGTQVDDKRVARQRTITKLDSVKEAEEIPQEISPTKVIKQFVNKHKTADLVAQISKISPEANDVPPTKTPERKNSLPDENLSKPTERRRSRIFETAEKFQSMSNFNNDKPKKIVIPGVSVGNFKKEFERKASLTSSTPSITSAERRALEKKHEDSLAGQGSESRKSSIGETEPTSPVEDKKVEPQPPEQTPVESSESRNSLANFSLEEARRSMENSIALLNQAKNESSRDVDQLCAKTESFVMSDDSAEREKKLKNAREIIGNAIQPGVRKPPVPFGINGRSISGSVVPPMSDKQRTIRVNLNTEPPDVRNATVSITSPEQKIFEKEPLSNVGGRAIGTPVDNLRQPDTTKTSKAEITLKSATLPRRKTTKAEIQLDIKPKIMEQPVHYSTEISHQIPDLRSAPAWEGPSPYSPLSVHQRANSLEPQAREHIIPIQKPPSYTRSNSSSLRSGSLSRQSTNESDTETATNQSQSTITGTSQPIKKSPREFIIPIAVEGGGYVTPRAGSLEPSESSHTSSSAAFSRIGRPRRVGSFLTEAESEEESPFQKMRNTSINRDNDLDEPRFAMHRLRSTRPVKKISQETNDSQSSGEDDDEDGFEILTAENLFSTLLQRVRALTNRLNVNNDIPSGFPNSRLLSNIRQTHSPFWHHEPFGRSQFNFSYKSTTVEKKLTSRLNNTPGAPWRHSMTRDISSDLDSMFSRAGATLPRGAKSKIKVTQNLSDKRTPTSDESGIASNTDTLLSSGKEETLDLADLDLSRLRLTKKDLETLSSITPGLPKCFQDQLLAKLPPNQARKLSRTLSMQNNTQGSAVRSSYKRSFSGGRETGDMMPLNDGKILSNETVNKEKDKETSSKYSENSYDSSSDRTISNQKSSVVNHYDQPSVNDVKSRSSSACKSSDEYSRSLCSSYSSEVSDKYKYCSSYLDKKNEYSRPLSPYKYYDTVKARPTCSSPTKEVYGRPPSGCLSPPPATSDSSVRRRSSQRRISRFLRPDFFDAPKDEASYRKERERETQSVLREIRERSRERSRDRCNRSVDRILSQSGETDYSIPHRNDYESRLETDKTSTSRYVRNKSVERFCDFPDTANDIKEQQRRRRSLSRPRELTEDSPDYAEKCAIAQKILDELESISASINQIKSRKEGSVPKTETTTVDSTTVVTKEKTIKKVKTKEKADIGTSSTIRSTKSGDNISTKKVVKTIKKKASTKNLDAEITAATVTDPMKAVSIDSDKLKKESKLVRPKSYPSKEPEKPTKDLTPPIDNSQEKEENLYASVKEPEPKEAAKTLRPKSYPNSKILPPKELKISSKSGGTISAVMEKFAEKLDKSERKAVTISKVKSMDDKPITPVKNETSLADVSVTVTLPKPVTKKIVKVKKVSKAESSIKSDEKSQDKKQQKQETSPDKVVNESSTRKLDVTEQEASKAPTVQKDKSPEKKVGKGILYTISQKFEKLRENAKSKEKKLALANSKDNEASASVKDKEKEKEKDKAIQNSDTPTATVTVKKKKSKATSDTSSAGDKTEDKAKSDRKSRIDVMIRTLRERSVPRAPVMTESGLIKRAVSVEDMSGTFNKCGVNKVLGIFKKFEKDESERKVLNTRSTSNIESHISGSSKDRPKSTGFVCKLRNTSAFSKSNKNDKHVEKTKAENHILENGTSNIMIASHQNPKVAENSIAQSQCNQCPECSEEKETSAVSKRNTLKETRAPSTEKEILKDKRKGLMLDFTKTNNEETQMRSAINGNILSNYTNLFGTSRHNNNNNVIAESDEVNQNHLYSPSNENMTNYSSDSRSPHEEYPSSSTFFSPTEERELCFDDWSICSEDNYMITSPSPAISRHSRISQFSSPTNLENNTESVIDRIKRRSFYCRFNEKKPKRQSNIVGPAARDYYRESASKTRTRPTERISSPEGESNRTTSHEYFKPLKLNSNVGNELKPALSHSKLKFDDDVKPSYKSPLEYTKSRTTNYNDILPPINSLTKRYDKDYYRTRNSTYDNSNNTTVSPTTTTTPSTYYSTYNPKRRSSFTLNGLIATPTSTTNNIVDGYATLGRRIRPYDNRSSSLLDGTTIASSGSSSLGTTLKRDPMRVGSEFGNIPKSNISLRTSSSSTSRSPSNI